MSLTLRQSLVLFRVKKMTDSAENLWQIREFAKRTKVTVRTLHYYDRIRLLKPQLYTRKGFSKNGATDWESFQK